MAETDVELETEHSDRLTLSRTNSDGSKLLTASADHRLAIYDVNVNTGEQTRLDVFSGHDAEVRDARWFDKTVGTYFITVGHDLQARIFVQDPTQAPMSGRRFRRIGRIQCEQFVPFMSVDVKTVRGRTFIVLIDRLGLLSLYEPSEVGVYSEWALVDQLSVASPPPTRGDNTCFRAVFDHNILPLPYIQNISDDIQQLTIAVSVFNEVKIYKTSSDRSIISRVLGEAESSPSIGHGGTHRLCLFEVHRIQPVYARPATSAGTLIRDLAFRPGNVCGSDAIALACSNGAIAVYELNTVSSGIKQRSDSVSKQSQPQSANHQSNLTTALHPSAAAVQTAQQIATRTKHPFPYQTTSWPVTVAEDVHFDTWSVEWETSGDLLLSTGSEGLLKIWKWIITSEDGFGTFQLIAEQKIEDDSDSDDSSFEEIDAKS